MTSDPLVGKTVGGRYEVLEIIGRGGLGFVYKVRQVHLDRICALKVSSEAVSRDQDGMTRFEREAKLASSLQNDNIVAVYDFGLEDAGFYYLVMEYVDGQNLENILQQQGRLPAERAIPVFLCITNALSFAHSKSIVHRDLKPSNVMITRDVNRQEMVKLLDFGLAKPFTEVTIDNDLTASGIVLGTPAFISPEQCLGGSVDGRTDIYSLGALMYKVLTGHNLFAGTSIYSIMSMHVSEPPRPFSETAPDINVPVLEQCVMKCLSKQPDARYQSALELRADLEMALMACWSQGATSTQTVATVLTTRPQDSAEVEAIRSAAAGGDKVSQYQLALVHLEGVLMPQSNEEYIHWLKQSAEAGYGQAQNALGLAYDFGPCEIDEEKAVHWFRKAAEQGVAEAMNDLACYYERVFQYPEMHVWYRKAAESGLSVGQSNYGRCHYYGIGTPVNYPEALTWLSSALVNDPENNVAHYLFGLSYVEGNGVPLDYEKAAQHFRNAAELEHPQACMELGCLYSSGDGVERNIDEAMRWLEAARELGDEFAEAKILELSRNSADITISTELVEQWMQQPNNQANKQLERDLISLVREPLFFVPDDLPTVEPLDGSVRDVVSELKVLSQSGHDVATMLLARCYERGIGVPRDPDRAQKLYRTVYDAGNETVEPHLVNCYRTCFEENIFPDDAVVPFLKKVANRRSTEAMIALASYYRALNPDGRQLQESVLWYRKAAELGDRDAQYQLGRFLVMKNRLRRERQGIVIRWWNDIADSNLDPAVVENFDEEVFNTESAEALRWLGKAADEGSCEALILLSALSNAGFLVEANKEEAQRLLVRASDLEDPRAQALLGTAILAGVLPGSETHTNSKAVELLDWAATAGDRFAQWNLAIELIQGKNVKAGRPRARLLLEESAQENFPQDKVWSEDSFAERFNILVSLFSELSEKGQREARYWLGLCLEHGIGATKDRDRSMLLYLKAAEQQYEPARQRFDRAPGNLKTLARKRYLNDLLNN